MTPQIQTLPPEVVNLIAAGEVIDSIAAVLRELAENALDAGANRITVSIWPESWRIRVADNGAGMDLENLQRCATPHSTSKIRDREDLWKISSLGFRGEALHSLAQLSRLEIRSRCQGSGEAWCLTYNEQGEPMKMEPVAIAPGTIITVSDLFGCWQARRQGLPSMSQQLRAVQQTIENIALCHPQVSWQTYKQDRPWFAIHPGKTAQDILPQLMRGVAIGDLEYVKVAVTAQQRIQVVLGLPDRCHRRRPNWVKVAVNHRMLRSPELEQAIISAFGRTLPRNRYPVCFVDLRINPDRIDWNRQPSKAEIYLQNITWWQQQLNSAISQALRLQVTDSPANQQRVTQLLTNTEKNQGYNLSRGVIKAMTESESPLISLTAVAQLHKTYIVAEHPNGIWLVEQHIAHERVIYEQLCDRWQLVPLEPPMILHNLTAAQLKQLERLGLDVSEFGNELWAVRNAPELLASREDCADALWELSLGGDLQTAQVATACRSAIRNGTTLSLSEMQTILDQWQRTRNPRTCPHGRPIYLSLEETDLARFFRRHWVIGKSHGI